MTRSDYYKAQSERLGIPPRTLAQVTAALSHKTLTAKGRLSFARLMLKHGRLEADARECVARIVESGK